MKIWEVGQKVEYPLATGRIESGIIEEVDDCSGTFKSNPWISIKTDKGRRAATQKSLMSSGWAKILLSFRVWVARPFGRVNATLERRCDYDNSAG